MMRTLVLTEDSGKDGHGVVRDLLACMFRLIEPGTQTQRVDFEPANEAARRVMRANGWESKKRRDLVDLRQTIAEKLMEEGFVFFHFDGDQRWSRRARCTRRGNFEGLIVDKVRIILEGMAERGRLDESVHDALGRLHAIVPFYSIEAWLFQNERVGCRLARDAGTDADHARFVAWAEDRTLLDDVHRPKEQVSFGAQHNAALTRGFPAVAVRAAGRSFAEVVERLSDDGALRAALAGTVEAVSR